MKKYSFLIAMAIVTMLAVGMVSCGDDDNDSETVVATMSSVVGEWKLVHQIDCEGEVRELKRDYVLSFSDDGYCIASSAYVFEAEIRGSKKYTVTGNILTIGSATYRIDKLTDQEMVLTWFDHEGETLEKSTLQRIK